MSIQRTAIFYIILILGEFSNVTFQGEVMAPSPLNNGIPSPNESELSSVNSDSSNKIPRSYWNPYTIAGMVSGAVIPIIYVLWRPPVSLKKEYVSVENLAGNMIGVSRLGIVVTTYLNLLSHFIEDRSFYALLPLTLLAGAGAAVGFGFGLCSMKLVDLFKVNTDHKSIVITNVNNHYVTNNFIILAKNDSREPYDPTVDVLNSENNVTGSKEQLSQVILQINGSVKKPCVSMTDSENCDNSSMVLASAITDVKNCTESMNNSNWEKFKSIWNKFTLWGAVAGAVVFSPVMILPQCLGFAKSGILPMSFAARMMSSSAIASGGGVVVGSLVAILQSIGALGVCSLGLIPIGIIIFIGAAFGFGIGYVVKMAHDWLNPDQINGLNDTASFDHNCKTIAQTNSGNSNLITNFTFDSEMNVRPTTNELLATNLSSTHDEAIDSENGRKKLDNRDRSSTKLANPQTVTDKVLNGTTILPPNEILTTSEKTQTLLKEINSETEVPINNQSHKIVHHIDLLNNSYIKPKFNNESVWPTPISNHSSLSVNLTTSFGAEIENGTFRHDNGLPAGDGSNTWDLIKTWSVNTWSDVRNGTENAWSTIVAWTKGDSVGSNACLSSSQPSVLLFSLGIYFLMTGSR